MVIQLDEEAVRAVLRWDPLIVQSPAIDHGGGYVQPDVQIVDGIIGFLDKPITGMAESGEKLSDLLDRRGPSAGGAPRAAGVGARDGARGRLRARRARGPGRHLRGAVCRSVRNGGIKGGGMGRRLGSMALLRRYST